jgi:hypothetical protein
MLSDHYLEIFLNPIRKCADYTPKFGVSAHEVGLTLADFKKLYGRDFFYSWIGLDSDLMYAAHKAAGGMTSIYRQIGVGCEKLFQEIICDATKYLDKNSATWSYSVKTPSGKMKQLSLDGRLCPAEILNAKVKENVVNWLAVYCKQFNIPQIPPNGIVFEVRQGYKSKDSKRQNGDIDNATVAWSQGYLPVFAIFSAQIDNDIVLRYRNNNCGILTGTNQTSPYTSLFQFTKEVLNYDIARFFKKNSKVIQTEIHSILDSLLKAS